MHNKIFHEKSKIGRQNHYLAPSMNKNNRFYYLTYGDPPSGVYFSQVLDVCRYLTVLAPQTRVQVISLLSPRLYRSGRKKIKARYPDAIVWPAMPGIAQMEGK